VAQGPCFYCLEPVVSVAMCLNCKAKLERAREDLVWYKNQAARERNNFFRLSKENRKLREEIAVLKRPRKK